MDEQVGWLVHRRYVHRWCTNGKCTCSCSLRVGIIYMRGAHLHSTQTHVLGALTACVRSVHQAPHI